MKLTKYMLAILGIGLVTSVHGGISVKSKVVNGCKIVIIKSGGIICPSSSTVCYYPTNQPGMLLQLNAASNPGLVGSVAGAAGTATSGGLIRPAKVNVNQAGGNAEGGTGLGGGGGLGIGGNGGAGGAGGSGGGHDGNNGNGGNPHFLQFLP